MIIEEKITFDRFIRWMLTAVVVIAVLLLMNYLSSVLLPFFVAWLLAYLIYPVVKFVQYRMHVPTRILSIAVTLLFMVAVIVGIFYLIIPPMIDQFDKLSDVLTRYLHEKTHIANFPATIQQWINENKNSIHEFFQQDDVTEAIRNAMPKVFSMIGQTASILLSVAASLITLLYLFFILLDYEQIANGWINLLPMKYRTPAIRITTDIKVSMNQYFRGQAMVAFCVGILFSIGFLIIDFPLAIGLGLFIGLLNMVPYLQIIGFVPTILLALLKAADTGENFWWILGMALLVFAVVQLIQDGFLVPKIMGKITGLNPAIILLSLSVWGSLMGMLGMIIALPCTSLLLSFYQRFIKKGNLIFLSSQEDSGAPDNEQ